MKVTKKVLKVCDEIDEHGLNDFECKLWAAREISLLRSEIAKAAFVVHAFARHTTEGGQFLSFCKQRRFWKPKK